MAADEEDDLYDEEFDFVDEEDEEEVGEDQDADEEAEDVEEAEEAADEEQEEFDEYGRPEEPAANYVVHIYEHKAFKRTVDRPFTPEDAEAFATEYNRTAKSYGRIAVAGKNDTKPKKTVD